MVNTMLCDYTKPNTYGHDDRAFQMSANYQSRLHRPRCVVEKMTVVCAAWRANSAEAKVAMAKESSRQLAKAFRADVGNSIPWEGLKI